MEGAAFRIIYGIGGSFCLSDRTEGERQLSAPALGSGLSEQDEACSGKGCESCPRCNCKPGPYAARFRQLDHLLVRDGDCAGRDAIPEVDGLEARGRILLFHVVGILVPLAICGRKL